MKTRIIQPTEQKPETPIKYPCLMRGPITRLVAIATGPSAGVTFSGNDTKVYGEESSTWASAGFLPVRGKVVIEFDMEDGQ